MKTEEYLALYGTCNEDAKLQTPSYIFDIDVLKERAEYLRRKLPGKRIVYAMKANPFIVNIARDYLRDKPQEAALRARVEEIQDSARMPLRDSVAGGIRRFSASLRD